MRLRLVSDINAIILAHSLELNLRMSKSVAKSTANSKINDVGVATVTAAPLTLTRTRASSPKAEGSVRASNPAKPTNPTNFTKRATQTKHTTPSKRATSASSNLARTPHSVSQLSLLGPDREKALLQDLRAGHPQAVKTWFKTFKPHLTRFVATKIDNQKDIEEIVQETFINSLKHLPLFRGGSSIWTWLCSIARHEIADYYRKRYAKKALKTLPLMDWLTHTPIMDAGELSERVNQTLSKMRPKDRNLLLGKYLDDLSVKELANQQGRTAKAIESDLFRARSQFRYLWESS